jgi:hypothetical protein
LLGAGQKREEVILQHLAERKESTEVFNRAVRLRKKIFLANETRTK